MLNINRHDDSDAELNMTPMIDCVFLLLIFFLCTASLKKPEKLLPVTLPYAAHAKDAKLQDEIVITITKEGERYIHDRKKYYNQAPVQRGEFIAYLYGVSQMSPIPPIRLDIDTQAPYVKVMEVVDSMELYGLRKLYLRSTHGSKDEND